MMMWSGGDNALYYSSMASYFEFMKYFKKYTACALKLRPVEVTL